MKRSKTCPKCEGTDVFHSAQVMDRGDGNEAMPLAIGRSDPIHGQDFGQFEVYVCKACGYSEFYAVNPGELE